MVNASQTEITQAIDAHGDAIEGLHHKLAQTPGIDQQRLQKAVETYKTAYRQFRDDALGCMN